MSMVKDKKLFLKVLNSGGYSLNVDRFVWPLPHEGYPGKWTEKITDILQPCKNGYHLCDFSADRMDILDFLGPHIYLAESFYDDILDPISFFANFISLDNKVVTRQARLIKKILSWDQASQEFFLADLLKQVLSLCYSYLSDSENNFLQDFIENIYSNKISFGSSMNTYITNYINSFHDFYKRILYKRIVSDHYINKLISVININNNNNVLPLQLYGIAYNCRDIIVLYNNYNIMDAMNIKLTQMEMLRKYIIL